MIAAMHTVRRRLRESDGLWVLWIFPGAVVAALLAYLAGFRVLGGWILGIDVLVFVSAFQVAMAVGAGRVIATGIALQTLGMIVFALVVGVHITVTGSTSSFALEGPVGAVLTSASVVMLVGFATNLLGRAAERWRVGDRRDALQHILVLAAFVMLGVVMALRRW